MCWSAIPSAAPCMSESNETVRAKAEAAKAAGLTRVICIGETEAERKAGETLKVLETAACRFRARWRHRCRHRHCL
jgi:triosephosphate isomerase